MKQRTYAVVLLLLSSIAMLSLPSCKEDTIINADLVPLNDTIYTVGIDTATILSKTFFDDTVATSLSISGIPIYHALGNVTTDPYSGNITSAIIFQVVPPSTAFTFSKRPDSVYLILPYANFSWGDTTNPNASQTYSVYQLTDSLSKDSVYYSNTNKSFSPTVLGSATVTNAQINDSTFGEGQNRAPQLRIALSQTLINDMFDPQNADHFASFAAFLSWFRGLYVTSTSNSGNVLHYFRLDGTDEYSRANLLFTYKDTTDPVSFYFTSQYGSHYNRIQRNVSGTTAESFFNSTAITDDEILIHNEPGGAADLKFPFLKNLQKAPINKAELIVTQVPSTNDAIYFSPERLFPVGVNTDGTTYTIQDRLPISSTEPLLFIDGKRRSVNIDGTTYSQYVINIPREVQKAIVEGKDTLHLRISGASGFPGAYRLVAGGSTYSNPKLRIKLNIVYSKL